MSSNESEENESEDEAPRVIIATLSALGDAVPADVSGRYGDRPVWFHLAMDTDKVEIFDRLPEDPMPKSKSDAILAVIRAYASSHNEDLQAVLGPTDSIQIGFHVDAKLDDVLDSFEDDGFDVVGTIEAGEVVEYDDEDEEGDPSDAN
jgi:hypothetical protein